VHATAERDGSVASVNEPEWEQTDSIGWLASQMTGARNHTQATGALRTSTSSASRESGSGW
jgi:hypothetical protein